MFQSLLRLVRPKPELRLEVGSDLVAIELVAASVATFGERYLKRVFTPGEVQYCSRPGAGLNLPSLAARFAAKEAVMKVLRPTADSVLPWHTIEVVSTPAGAPELKLNGAAASLAAKLGIGRLALSLSHDGAYASAVVIALCPN